MSKGDLISREALRKEVAERVNFTTVDGHIAYDKMLELIDNAPTLSVHEIITNQSYLREFRNYGFEPIPNKYEMHIDTNCLMLRCPRCKCGIIATAFSYAVGSNGYAFCPYCGEDMRKGEKK